MANERPPHPDGAADKPGVPTRAHHADGCLFPLSAVESAEQAHARHRLVYTALQALILRDDGYLKFAPHEGGRTVYFKFKYVHGKWAGYYAMRVGTDFNWQYGLVLLADLVDAIDMGIKRPVKDRPYEE